MLGNMYDGDALPEGFVPIGGKAARRQYTPAEVCLLAIKRHNRRPVRDSLMAEARLCESGGGALVGKASDWDAASKRWRNGAHITYRLHRRA